MTESTHLHTQEPSSSQNTKSIFNLPNNLTIARILMIPLFVAIAYWPPAMGIGMPAISDNVIARVGMSEFSDSLLRHLLLTSVFIIAAIAIMILGCHCTSTIKATATMSLSATGSKKRPNADMTFSLRAK